MTAITPAPASPSPGPGVVTAGPGDIEVLSHLIAEAFLHLPPSRWLIADPAARKAIFPAYFRIYVEQAVSAGIVHTTPDRAAAALWLPAGATPAGPPPGYGPRLAAITGCWHGRFTAFDAALERRHPADTAHHYLALLAVHPHRQHHGTGSMLLRAHHAHLDYDATAAYLEAATVRTRRLYHRHGYTDHGPPIRLPDGGPSMWPMWRPPRR
jgi:ribosomal protein S18 acetylase RimI-like enzyme